MRGDTDEAENFHPSTSIESSMHVDDVHSHPSLLKDTNNGLDSDSEDDEKDDPSDVAMVPMADILNARWGSENVSSDLPYSACILVSLCFIRFPCQASSGYFRN